MKLFFETSCQAQVFLWLCALGFLCALGCDALRKALRAYASPLCDVLAALLYGAALVSALVLFRGEGLRLYHALSLLVGTLLYRCGLQRLSDWLLSRGRACAQAAREARAQKKSAARPESIAKRRKYAKIKPNHHGTREGCA